MRINRRCKICGKQFYAIKITQFFCCRKCFKKDYYFRTKVKLQEEKQNPHYPIKKCSFCSEVSKLNFDPTELPQLFDAWACPYCGATNKLIWEYHGNPNSYQAIKSILVSFKTQFSQNMSSSCHYQTYQIPIMKLDSGNPSIIVMTCEKLNITDIQRKNRKRLLFS
jgi:DNA-directed RNA polymerase subunit RPC12/RpoP